MSVRVRFAPSPTGPLHIGGVRTALYNYLFAKKNNGTFILRIEDTDQNRYVEGAEQYIIDSLKWLGMVPDEGPGFGGDYPPYRQSERRDIYAEYVKRLIDNGKAYRAFDTPEEIEKMREKLQAEGVHTPKYDHTVRGRMKNSLSLSEEEVQTLIDNGTPYTVRLKVDPGETVAFNDLVRGEISFSTDELDDKVLMKADGLPTYHLANVVDDHLMKITHVIRGEEWLSSTAHHVLLYRGFGWAESRPDFAHLPLILKPTGKGKLSKRDGAKFGFPVFPMDWQDKEGVTPGFYQDGFVPDAMLNFLAFLGWNPGTEQEVFSLEELIAAFSIDHIHQSGARFDYEKAKWFNAQHIKEMDVLELKERLESRFPDVAGSNGTVSAVLDLYRERVDSMNEFKQIIAVYSPGADVAPIDTKLIRKKWSPEMKQSFESLAQLLEGMQWDDAESMAADLKSFIKDNGLKFGDVFRLMRTAVSGTDQGPDLVSMLQILGKDEALKRMQSSLSQFDQIKADSNE